MGDYTTAFEDAQRDKNRSDNSAVEKWKDPLRWPRYLIEWVVELLGFEVPWKSDDFLSASAI